jgi:endonuclease I
MGHERQQRRRVSGIAFGDPKPVSRISAAILAWVASFGLALAQTQPLPQTLPYSQDFGTIPFTGLPSGIAAWSGLSGVSINTQALAAGTTPTANAILAATENAGPTAGSFGYATAGNARFYIQTSGSTTNGVNQLALAVNTIGQAGVTLQYDVESMVANTRTIGVVCQYRVGNTGGWSTLAASTGLNPYSQSGGSPGLKTSPNISLPAAAMNQPTVQIRWAIWRGSESGNSSGIAIDNIVVTGSPAGNTLAISVSRTSLPENGGTTALVTVTTSSPVTSDLPVTLTINDPTELLLETPNPSIIPAGASATTFTVRAVDDAIADGPQAVSLFASAPSTVPASTTLTVVDDEDGFSPPTGYYDAAEGLTGAALKAALNSIISEGHVQFTYSGTLPPLRAIHEDPANPANLLTVYSGTSLGKFANFYTGQNGDTTWSREHVWPVSFGLNTENVDPGFNDADAGPDYTDLFNLRPVLQSVNSARSNLYFDQSSGNVTVPALAPLCSRDADSWQPRDVEKGDLARTALYMIIRYDGTDAKTIDLEAAETPNDGAGRFAKLSTLLFWHQQDPVSPGERRMNHLIHSSYQNNRNPFIDHPGYASLIWSGSVQAGKSSATVTEGGAGDSYTLFLTSQPDADVTVNLSSSPVSQITTIPASVTFTPANWNQPQTITLAAVNDTVNEATLIATVSHAITSADPGYASSSPSDVSVTVIDNDPVISATSLPIQFGGPWSPLPTGFVGTGLGSPYAGSLGGDTGTGSAKFDHTGDRLVIAFNSPPSTLSYWLDGNPASGTATEGTFGVQESPDGVNYTTLLTLTNKDNTEQAFSHVLSSATRFIAFVYQEKTGGNLQLDKLSITGSAWLAWQSGYGLSGPDAAPGFDFEHDGFSNLAEYALGGSPVVSDSGAIAPVIEKPSDKTRFTAILRTNDPSLSAIPEASTDLTDPNSWIATGIQKILPTSQTGVAPGFERMVFEIDDAGSARRFVRLRLELE